MSEITTLGIIGDPVAHSISPAMHNAALRVLAIDEHYTRWHTPADHLAERVHSLRNHGRRGANVTLPHKVAVVSLLDRCVALAHEFGAVNTIVREHDGTLTGYNTDAPAFRDSLSALGVDGATTHAVILGAGGAARAALWALRQLNCRSISVINRNRERAAELVQAHEQAFSPDDSAVSMIMHDATLLINATSLGWNKHDLAPCQLDLLHGELLVYDMVYRDTPLLQAARTCGATTSDGLDMLVRQAGLAFELWFGVPAPLDVMRHAAERALQGNP